jgi:hypothetical protein
VIILAEEREVSLEEQINDELFYGALTASLEVENDMMDLKKLVSRGRVKYLEHVRPV